MVPHQRVLILQSALHVFVQVFLLPTGVGVQAAEVRLVPGDIAVAGDAFHGPDEQLLHQALGGLDVVDGVLEPLHQAQRSLLRHAILSSRRGLGQHRHALVELRLQLMQLVLGVATVHLVPQSVPHLRGQPRGPLPKLRGLLAEDPRDLLAARLVVPGHDDALLQARQVAGGLLESGVVLLDRVHCLRQVLFDAFELAAVRLGLAVFRQARLAGL
mmetsp:Transcript_44020/g.126070  ORF Transcript_44020/g.126070 Transcript_44020/m.126070 type:complete len:215 (-) Transcript_44020:816-1460(-)